MSIDEATSPIDSFAAATRTETQTKCIVAALELSGWARGDGVAIATKAFDTVNGRNDALAFITKGDGINRTLYFEYTSEGRNVAESNGALIPAGATAKQAAILASASAARAEKSIQESYGVRLAASRQDRTEEPWF